jgi:ABC-type transport system involved in multi-copper enzyme maturation permease subunit
MIWLTWRQFRTSGLIGFGLTAVLIAAYVATRGSLLGLASDLGFTGCTGEACANAADQFLRQVDDRYYGDLQFGGSILLFVLPALIGLFWGAPLVARELEAGTHRLVWNQTITRTRWLAVKLGGVGLVTVALVGLLTWAITAWASPIDRAGNWMEPMTFTVRGIVPIGYAAFGFVAGVTIGMLMRRTVAAMAVTLVVVGAAMFLSLGVVRSHLVTPTTFTTAVTADRVGSIGISLREADMHVEADNPVEHAWILSNDVLTSAGVPFRGPADLTKCGRDAVGGPEVCREWIASQNLQQKVIYLGSDKFWTLQWRELGIFVAVSVLLATFCFWWIRRRVA